MNCYLSFMMKKNVESVLGVLGFSPRDLENESEFGLLEELLSCVGPENILSVEEIDMLENVDIPDLGETDVLKMLKNHGIDEDALEIDESDIELIQNKLTYFESDVWDSEVHGIRNLKNRLQRSVVELKNKSFDKLLEGYTQDCQNEWKQMESYFNLLFKDIQELESLRENSENTETFLTFFNSFKIEVGKFIDLTKQYINKNAKVYGVNLTVHGENMEENALTENAGQQTCVVDIFNVLSTLQSRLAATFYNMNSAATKSIIDDLLVATNFRNNLTSEILSSENEHYLLSMINLCENWAKMEVKEKIILPKFEEYKVRRESLLKSSDNLIPVLQKQVDHQRLVSIVVSLWNKDHNVLTDLLVGYQQHFEEQVMNVVSRVNSLREAKLKYELFFNTDEYKMFTLVEKLTRLSEEHSPSGNNKSLKNFIDEKEEELNSVLNNQRKLFLHGKRNLLKMEKYINELIQKVNLNLIHLFQVQEGYTESVSQLQLKEVENLEVMDQLEEHPLLCRMRMLWIYFLTDQKKLLKLKEDVVANAGNEVPRTPVLFTKSSFATSTPKENEG